MDAGRGQHEEEAEAHADSSRSMREEGLRLLAAALIAGRRRIDGLSGLEFGPDVNQPTRTSALDAVCYGLVSGLGWECRDGDKTTVRLNGTY